MHACIIVYFGIASLSIAMSLLSNLISPIPSPSSLSWKCQPFASAPSDVAHPAITPHTSPRTLHTAPHTSSFTTPPPPASLLSSSQLGPQPLTSDVARLSSDSAHLSSHTSLHHTHLSPHLVTLSLPNSSPAKGRNPGPGSPKA